MAQPVIHVEQIGKRYRLGTAASYQTIRETIVSLAGAPLAALRRKSRGRRQEGQAGDDSRIWALKDISFDVHQGDVLGVIGRNGAGKSTLLKILARITEPSAGRITMRGRVGSLLEVGTGFHPELTGHENIYLYGAILGMERQEVSRKFDAIVEFAELEQFIHTPVKRYSSGMYMRLAFAVAAQLESEILLVDEVLAVGDASFQRKCLGRMGEVSNEGRTVLFVSHNMSSVQRLCTKGLLLNKGGIVAQGSAAEVTELYMRDGGGACRAWQRQGETVKQAFFERIGVGTAQRSESDAVTTADSLRLTMEFTVAKKSRDLQLSVGLLDRAGDIIFATEPQDGQHSVPDTPGTYVAHVQLPAQTLLASQYGILAVLWQPGLGVIDRVDEVRFSVQEADSFSSRTPQGRTGKIAVKCDWEIGAAEGQRLIQPGEAS